MGNEDTKKAIVEHFRESIKTKELFLRDVSVIEKIAAEIVKCYRRGNKVVWFGNGGSAADAQHLACELVSKFYVERKALRSLALTTNTSILTAVGNDYSFDKIFKRQVEAVVDRGDVVIGISTSGNSPNVLKGIQKAKEIGAIVVGFTGKSGGKLRGIVDYLLKVPSENTPRIQETHITAGHIICYLVENRIFGAGKK